MSPPPFLSEKLNVLEQELMQLPDSTMGKRIKLNVLLLLYLRYERIHFNDSLQEDPYLSLARIVDDSSATLHAYTEILPTENQGGSGESFVEKENQEQK